MHVKKYISAHTVVALRVVEGALGNAIPILIIGHGVICFITMAWIRGLMLAGYSSQSLWKAAEAVGKLYDYYHYCRKDEILDEQSILSVASGFYESRKNGYAQLGWDSVKEQTASDDLRWVNNFSDFAVENYDFLPLNPSMQKKVEELSFQEQQLWRAKIASRKNWDFLFHLVEKTKHGKGLIQKRHFEPKKPARQPSIGESFPLASVRPFFGAIISLRDRLLFLLTFFGGVRISEPLHIFIGDVSIRSDGSARVIIAHPANSKYEWISHAGLRQHGSRATFLRNKYGLGPRNALDKENALFVGFKGMSWDDGKKLESEVYWLFPQIGQLFAKLHAEYMRTVRSIIPDMHPYYFVNTDVENFGSPLKYQTAINNFTKTAKRAQLVPYRNGVRPHGGRHFYGNVCANYFEISQEMTQHYLHHVSASSTGIYYRIGVARANKELSQGYARMSEKSRSEITPLLDFFK